MRRLSKLHSYSLIIILINISGNPLFTRSLWIDYIYVLIFLYCFVVYLLAPKKIFTKRFFYYFFSFTLIFIFQYLKFDWSSGTAEIGFLIKCFIGAFIVRYTGFKFRKYYLNSLYVISAISLFFYFLTNLNLFDLPTLITINNSELLRSVGIYHSATGLLHNFRNFGLFWEAGAFAGYIIIALVLNLDDYKKNFFTRKYLIITIALLTTFSTAGYILYFITLIYINVSYFKDNRVAGSIILLSVIVITIISITRISFLGEKLQSQYKASQNLNGEYDPSRLGALLFDLHYISRSPFVGNGLHERTRYADHPWLKKERGGHGNGFSNFIASMGLIGIILYFYMLYESINKYKHSSFIIIIVILLLQTQQFMNFPLFLGLPFLFIRND